MPKQKKKKKKELSPKQAEAYRNIALRGNEKSNKKRKGK